MAVAGARPPEAAAEADWTIAPEGTRCFACDRLIRSKRPHRADTRDGQWVFVGAECFKLIQAAGPAGYQPPRGGPRLFPF